MQHQNTGPRSGGIPTFRNTEGSTGHGPEQPAVCVKLEVGPDDLQREGPSSPEFLCDSNAPRAMRAKTLSALHVSSLVSGIASAFISWSAAELTQILYILSRSDWKGTWQFLCISISLVPCTLTFKTS